MLIPIQLEMQLGFALFILSRAGLCTKMVSWQLCHNNKEMLMYGNANYVNTYSDLNVIYSWFHNFALQCLTSC